MGMGDVVSANGANKLVTNNRARRPRHTKVALGKRKISKRRHLGREGSDQGIERERWERCLHQIHEENSRAGGSGVTLGQVVPDGYRRPIDNKEWAGHLWSRA